MLETPGVETRPDSTVPKREKPRAPASEILPSDRFSFLTHVDVVKRFVTLSHNGSQALDASRVEGQGIPAQAASLNVRFLKSIGLLTRTDRGQYLPTPEAIKFVTARSVSEEKARPILASLIEPTWIVLTARSVLSPTKPTKDEVLLGELAIAAQTDRERKGDALRVLIDYLMFAGIVTAKEDGLVLVGPQSGNSGPNEISTRRSEDSWTPLTAASSLEQLGKGWQVIQTDDFTLRVKSNVKAVDDLLEYLHILRRQIERRQSMQEKTTEVTTVSPN